MSGSAAAAAGFFAGLLHEKYGWRGLAVNRFKRLVLPLLFGMGSYAEADTVRISWPNGLIQNEMKQAPGKTYNYEEAQRMSGSSAMRFHAAANWRKVGGSSAFACAARGTRPK